MSKPNPLRLKGPTHVKAFTDAKTIDRWREESAGVQARAQDETTITIYDIIGEDWWTGDGFTVKRLNAALRSIGDKDITVNINSPGGDVFEGVAIFNELLQHPGKVTVNIVGNASSAASFIAMAGDEIYMGKGSTLMIHDAMSGCYGTAAEMHEVAEYVEKISNGIAELYAERAEGSAEDFRKMMCVGSLNLGTWFTADEAIEIGLADGHYEGTTQKVENKRSTDPQAHTKREAEQLLTRAGMTRSAARSLLGKFSGKQDAVSEDDKQDAVSPELAALAASFKADLTA